MDKVAPISRTKIINDDGLNDFPPKKCDVLGQIFACRWNIRKRKGMTVKHLAKALAWVNMETWLQILTSNSYTTWDNKDEARSSFRITVGRNV